MQKGFAPVFILVSLAIMIIGVGAYFIGKNMLPRKSINDSHGYITVEEGLNLKTYNDQNLGLQLTYSKDLTVKQDSEEEFNKRGNGDFRKNFKGYVQYEPGKFLGAVVVLEKEASYDKNPFTVWVFSNDSNLTIEQWYQQYWYYPFVWGDFTYKGKFELAPKDEATISGQIGKSGIIDYQPGKPKFVYLSKDKKMYLFRIIGESGNQILATLKFSNQQTAACKVTGCSGQICSDQDVITTCEWQEQYACYKGAKCERQADGECGWTKKEELQKCFGEKGAIYVDKPNTIY